MTENEQRELDETYPLWKPTDWTPRQRNAAIGGLLLLGVACALIAGAFIAWGIAPLALYTVVPIGMSLLCLGTTLLTYVIWYAYKHARNGVGEHASTAMGAYGMLAVEGLVALVSLLLQLVGAALVATVGWPGWQGYSPFSFLVPMGVCVLVSVGLNWGEQMLSWRPTRDPEATDSTLSAPVTGVRFALRWAVMVVASNSWLLLGAALYARINIESQVAVNDAGYAGTNKLIQPLVITLLLAGGFFLIAALVELTHQGRVTVPASEAA